MLSTGVRGGLAVPVVVLVLSTAALGGCGGSAPVGSAPVSSASGPASARDTPSGGHRPESDRRPRARRAGPWVVRQLSVSTVAGEVPGRGSRLDRSGLGSWAEEVRTCVRRSSTASQTTGWGDWSVLGSDGHVYAANPARAGRAPVPRYPTHRRLAPGQCATGWWRVAVPPPPGGAAAIRFAPGAGATVIEWTTLR